MSSRMKSSVTVPQNLQEEKRDEETKAWIEVIDSIAEVISASKTMIQIFGKKMVGFNDEDIPVEELYRSNKKAGDKESITEGNVDIFSCWY